MSSLYRRSLAHVPAGDETPPSDAGATHDSTGVGSDIAQLSTLEDLSDSGGDPPRSGMNTPLPPAPILNPLTMVFGEGVASGMPRGGGSVYDDMPLSARGGRRGSIATMHRRLPARNQQQTYFDRIAAQKDDTFVSKYHQLVSDGVQPFTEPAITPVDPQKFYSDFANRVNYRNAYSRPVPANIQWKGLDAGGGEGE